MTVARRVISNAGPLMALAKLNRLDLLANLYQQVELPAAPLSLKYPSDLRALNRFDVPPLNRSVDRSFEPPDDHPVSA